MLSDNNRSETWGAVAPVHQLVLPLDGLAELRWPVAVLFLLHKEVHALPHQFLVWGLKVLMVRKKHLEDGRQAMSCSYIDKQSIINSHNWEEDQFEVWALSITDWWRGWGKPGILGKRNRHKGYKGMRTLCLLETMLDRTREGREKAWVWRGRQAIYKGACKSCLQGVMGSHWRIQRGSN